ncbi:hypothetical protein CRE_29786 [Caenorhabditis remanei]|uniref:Uncharacterized protein n=1 Tax=Caenorhabditis remanei TaxID=31234 RepID=E3LVT2_CAERE|nr:hypothetical protein CRE_29786 [Caenorhabditis remanei]
MGIDMSTRATRTLNLEFQMKTRDGREMIQCEVQSTFTVCFCEIAEGNCWDFSEIMESVYTISRDISTFPKIAFVKAGNNRKAVENIQLILNSLHKNAPELSTQLLNFSMPTSTSNKIFDKKHCKKAKDPSEEDIEKLKNRREVGLLIRPGKHYCFKFFSRIHQDFSHEKSTIFLMMREKLLDQINSNDALYLCDKNETCEFEKIKKILPQKLDELLEFTNSITDILMEHPVIFKEAKKKFKFDPEDVYYNQRFRGIVISWIFGVALLVLVSMIGRSVCSYEIPDERTTLQGRHFKLKDIEKELKRKLLKSRGEESEKSWRTVEAEREMRRAIKLDKKREKKRKLEKINVKEFPTLPDNSPPGGNERNIKIRKNDSEFELQNTQEDIAEFIGTAVEVSPPLQPAIPVRRRHEKSLPSRTDQGTFVTNIISDNAAAQRSLMKTQTVSDPDVLATPPTPSTPLLGGHQPSTPLLGGHQPKVRRISRPKTPLPHGQKQSRTPSSQSRCDPSDGIPKAISRTPKEKSWLRFWT